MGDKLNLNDIAMDIAAAEGKKVSVNIAQIKEILKIVFSMPLEKLVRIWFKYN